MSVIQNTLAGKNLSLWYGNASEDRMKWSESILNEAALSGFHRVYTPHIHNLDIYDLADIPKEIVFSDKKENISFLGSKFYNHLCIFQTECHSYNDLPISYIELDEYYFSVDSSPHNELSLWITTISDKQETELMHSLIERSENEKIVFAYRFTSTSTNNKLFYRGSDNKDHTPVITCTLATYKHIEEI